MCRIVICSNEKKLADIAKCVKTGAWPNINYIPDIAPLDVGDIHFYKDDDNSTNAAKIDTPILIVERKTGSDLNSSLSDGRWREQKLRAKECVKMGSQIVYLIEGLENDLRDPRKAKFMDYNLMRGALLNTVLRDKMHVLYSRDLKDTVEILINLAKKIDEFFSEGAVIDREYHEVVKLKKGENMTPEVCYLVQLRCIPRVSAHIAKKIAAEYPTLRALITAYDTILAEDPSEKKASRMLATINVSHTTDKVRKLGPKLSETIYKFIYQQ